jgi:transcriptional regulator with XRE-family HTH domain
MGRANVTQQQLAAQIGISPAGLSERLSGQRPFTTDHLYAIAEALAINPLTLLTPPSEAVSA